MTTHSDRIQELLDGELDSLYEVDLFAQIASNADLRNEFKQQLALRATVGRDRAALVPPIALTNSLFSGLGFAVPLAGAAAGTAGGGLLLQWLGKLGLPILSAVTAVGVTIGSGFVGNGSSNSTIQVSADEPLVTAAESRDAITGESDVQSRIEGLATQLQKANATIAELRASQRRRQLAASNAELRSQPTPSAAPPQVTESPSETPQQTIMPDLSVQRLEISSTLNVMPSASQREFQTQVLDVVTPDYLLYPSFMIQLRGLSLQGMSTVSTSPELSWYDNASVAFLYQLSDRSVIGMEIGNEAFPQVFEHNRNGQVIRTEQYPASTWGGITYRHHFDYLGSSLRPFVQALAGGTRFGPLGRLGAGLQYSPAGSLSFIAGIEGSVSTFTIQDTWYASSKLGFTYGMSVRF